MGTKQEYLSVDLTEDETSGVDISHKNTPFNFVDCGKAASSMSPIVTNTNQQETPPKKISSGMPKHLEVVSNENTDTNVNNNMIQQKTNSIGKFHSVQIRPPTATPSEKSTIEDTTRLETVSLDSDEEEPREEPNCSIPKPQTASDLRDSVQPTKQTGKVVVLKKNNKLYKIVIPHNVMPNVNKTVGPVLINIPEVGPLVITMDPRVTKAAKIPSKQMQQIVNLDKEGQGSQNIDSTPKQKRATLYSERDALLSDKKFCWTYIKGRKRDLDGFTYNDRLGFNRAESLRARKCWKTLDVIVSKKRRELIRLMHTYNRFRDSRNHTIKLVKINEIVGKTPKKPRKARLTARDIKLDPPPASEAEDTTPYYDSELLLTKRVVFLEENEEGNHVETRKHPVKSSQIMKRLSKRERARRIKERTKKIESTKRKRKGLAEMDLYKSFNLKPCYVEMVREQYIEDAYMNQFKKVPSTAQSRNKKPAKRNVIQRMKLVRSHRNRNSNARKKMIQNEIPIIDQSDSSKSKQPITCLPELEMLNYTFQNITKIFQSKIIISEARFVREINLLKPILVIHEYNVRSINYSDEFSKNNIVFVVQESMKFPDCILSNQQFVSAVELGYLKLVASKLFCKFVSGSINVLAAKKHINDHNYCINKK